MLGSAAPIAFVPSTDLERSRSFFADLLGLAVEELGEYALVLRVGTGAMLRVTKVEDLRPQPFTVFGWQVDDLHSTLAALAAAGVPPLRYEGMAQDDAGAWATPRGDRIAWFQDPDGNVLSLTEFAS